MWCSWRKRLQVADAGILVRGPICFFLRKKKIGLRKRYEMRHKKRNMKTKTINCRVIELHFTELYKLRDTMKGYQSSACRIWKKYSTICVQQKELWRMSNTHKWKLSVVAITHQELKRRDENFGSAFTMIMGCVVPNMIKKSPENRCVCLCIKYTNCCTHRNSKTEHRAQRNTTRWQHCDSKNNASFAVKNPEKT